MESSKFYRDSFDGILSQFLMKIQIKERTEYKFNILLIIAGVLTVALINLYSLKDTTL